MPSNYSDSPSMDEILDRIKKALSEREARSSAFEEDETSSNFSRIDNSHNNQSLTFEQMKELSSSKEMTDKIVGGLVEDEIFIKPVAKAVSSDEVVTTLNKEDKVASDDVFVLTKNMKRKVEVPVNLSNVDFDLMFKNISVGLGRDLAISYLVPKIESWLRINWQDVVAKSQKK